MNNKALVLTCAMVTAIALVALYAGNSDLASMCAGGVIGVMSQKRN